MENNSTNIKLDCKQFANLVQLIVDDEASEEQKALFINHEKKCGHCAEVYNIEKSVIDLVKTKLKRDCCTEGFANKVRQNAINADS